MNLNDLIKEIPNLSDEELLSLVNRIRKDRFSESVKPKKTQRKPRSESHAALELSKLLEGLTKEEVEEILRHLRGPCRGN